MACPRLSLALVFAACADPAGGADLEIAARCGPIESLSLPTTQVDQVSNALLQFTNRGTGVEHGLAVKLDGPDARDFLVSNACSNELAPGDLCMMEVQLAPTTTGDKRAVLHVGSRTLTLSGTAVAKSTGLFVSVANLDYAFGPGGPSQFYLSNQGSSAITLAPPHNVDTDGFLLNMTYMCPSLTLTPGGACVVQLGVAQIAGGCVSATARVASDAGAIDLPVTSEFIPIASASVAAPYGPAQGRVTSDPPAIDCDGPEGPGCSARVNTDTITFTATAGPGAHFYGWGDARCGMSPQCTRRVGPLFGAATVVAYFEPSDGKTIDITFGGQGTGRVTDGLQICNASCTMRARANESPVLQAFARSQFGGWTGACTGTNPRCSLGPTVNDRQLTVIFDKDPHEVDTATLPLSSYAAAYLPGGDLVLAGNSILSLGSLLSRVTPGGAIVWTRLTVGGTAAIATTADGSIFGLVRPSALYKLSADGAPLWRIDLAIGDPVAIAAHGDDVIVLGSAGVAARAASDGAMRWSAPLVGNFAELAVGPDGIVAVGISDQILRFTRDGVPLPTWTVPGPSTRSHLTYDAAGNLFVASDSSFPIRPAAATLSRFSPGGTVDFSVDLDTSLDTAGGPLIAAGDQILTVRTHHTVGLSDPPSGAFLEAYSAAGARLWQVDKPAQRSGPGYAFIGFARGFFLRAPDGAVRLIGQNNSFGGETQIERLAP